jgi:hypothetical protein
MVRGGFWSTDDTDSTDDTVVMYDAFVEEKKDSLEQDSVLLDAARNEFDTSFAYRTFVTNHAAELNEGAFRCVRARRVENAKLMEVKDRPQVDKLAEHQKRRPEDPAEFRHLVVLAAVFLAHGNGAAQYRQVHD